MTCFCCAGPLVRATNVPDARWLRQGDLFCRNCDLLIRREQLVEGWPAERAPCQKHREATAKEEA
jgi:hypothetical protein